MKNAIKLNKFIPLILLSATILSNAQITYDTDFSRRFLILNSGVDVSRETNLPPLGHSDRIRWTGINGSEAYGEYTSSFSSNSMAFSAYSSMKSATQTIQVLNPDYDPDDPSNTEPKYIDQVNSDDAVIYNLMGGFFTVAEDAQYLVRGTGLTSENYINSYAYFSILDQTTGERPLQIEYSASGTSPLPDVEGSHSGSFEHIFTLYAGHQYHILVDANAGHDTIANDDTATWSSLDFKLQQIPEPSSALLLSAGLLLFVTKRKRL